MYVNKIIKIINVINKNYNNSHTYINLYKYIIEDTSTNNSRINSIQYINIKICREFAQPDEKYKYEVNILLH